MKTSLNSFIVSLRLFVALFLSFIASTFVNAQSTMNSENHFAYGANTGWLNARPSSIDGVIVGETFLSGHIYAANFGWISLGDGTPVNGHTYSNNSATDYGVNHDELGNLYGYAYSANIGWINFGWTTTNDPNRPRYEPLTGNFTGYGYSANTGWITIGTGILLTESIAIGDEDRDGISDAWEFQKFGNLSIASIGSDKDGDGISDAAEFISDTDPNNAADFFRLISLDYNADLTQLTVQLGTTRSTRKYRIQSSSALQDSGPGAWVSTGATFSADPGTTTTKVITFPTTNARFFRATAERPLP